MQKKLLEILLIFFGCLILFPGIVQETNLPGQSHPMKVTRIPGGITFDGVPDEAVWKEINSDINFSWNTFRDAKTVMTENRWAANSKERTILLKYTHTFIL